MSEWKEYRLYDLADKIAMGPFGSNIKVETFKESGIPIISGMHLHGIRLLDKDFNYISEEHAKRLSNSNVYRHDVIFTHAGTIGQVAYIPETSKFERYIISQRQFYLRCNPNKLDYKYITYFFKSPYGQFLIDSNTNQTGVPSIAQPATFLKNVDILLPPLPEQKAIAGVLSSLDDKIDLLHRQNKTLEAMAETLFRQWFVLGNMTNGNSEKFGDLVEFRKGRKPSNAFEVSIDGLIPQILIETFDTGITLYSDPLKMIIAEDKDILMVMDGASSGRVEIGFNGIVGSTIGLFRPLAKFNYPLFLYYFLKTNEDFIKDNTTGSAIPHADKSLILDLDVEFKLESVMIFEEIVSNYFRKKLKNKFQIHTLEKLRDTLLPKLMSGEVRVKV